MRLCFVALYLDKQAPLQNPGFSSNFTSKICTCNAVHFLLTHCRIATVVSLLCSLQNVPKYCIINMKILLLLSLVHFQMVSNGRRTNCLSMEFLPHSTFRIRPIVFRFHSDVVLAARSPHLFPCYRRILFCCPPHINAQHNNQFSFDGIYFVCRKHEHWQSSSIFALRPHKIHARLYAQRANISQINCIYIPYFIQFLVHLYKRCGATTKSCWG